MDFWISQWISGFHSGFLDFSLDFWISGFQFGFLPTVYEISFVTDPSLACLGSLKDLVNDNSCVDRVNTEGGRDPASRLTQIRGGNERHRQR